MMSLELRAFEEFNREWKSGKFGNMRYGQAFYSHFRIDKTNQGVRDKLEEIYYEKNPLKVKQLIYRYFDLT